MNLDNLRQFIRNPLLATLFGVSMFLSLANLVVLFFFIRKLNTSIILHYNVYMGVDVVGTGKQALLMPLVGLVFAVINLILAYYFFSQKERMISHMLSLTAFVLQLGITVANASVLIVNYF